jgi:dual specificity phosphatase 12
MTAVEAAVTQSGAAQVTIAPSPPVASPAAAIPPGAAAPAAAPAVSEAVYCCRQCRMRLFAQRHVLPHNASDDAPGHKAFQRNKRVEASKGNACTSVFVDFELLQWVRAPGDDAATASNDEKDLLCPNARCKVKLGSRLWQGTQCSCGAWVTPAFKVLLSRVDVFASG